MKIFAFVTSLVLIAPNAFAAEQLCREQASKALRDQMKGFDKKSPEFLPVGEPDYSVYKNMEGTMVVHYEFNLLVGVKKQEKRFARVTLTKKGCNLVASDSFKSKEDAEADDQDAAETPDG